MVPYNPSFNTCIHFVLGKLHNEQNLRSAYTKFSVQNFMIVMTPEIHFCSKRIIKKVLVACSSVSIDDSLLPEKCAKKKRRAEQQNRKMYCVQMSRADILGLFGLFAKLARGKRTKFALSSVITKAKTPRQVCHIFKGVASWLYLPSKATQRIVSKNQSKKKDCSKSAAVPSGNRLCLSHANKS